MDLPQGHREGEGELVTHRGDLTEGGMSAMGIVPTLDELEHGMAGFLGRTEGSTIEEFTLQSGEETLTQSVVVAISERSHRRANAGLATTLPEGQRGVLATVIRVVDDAMGVPLMDGHVQSLQHQFGAQVSGHGPTYHSAAPGVQYHRQVQEPGPRREG